MFSSTSGSEDRFRTPSSESVHPIPAPGRSTERNLLEEILRQTVLASTSKQSFDDQDEIESLLAVARRYRGHAFTLEPVAVELVHASLVSQFQMLASPSRDWRKLSARIAQTLFEDPVLHDQLEALWKRLSAVH